MINLMPELPPDAFLPGMYGRPSARKPDPDDGNFRRLYFTRSSFSVTCLVALPALDPSPRVLFFCLREIGFPMSGRSSFMFIPVMYFGLPGGGREPPSAVCHTRPSFPCDSGPAGSSPSNFSPAVLGLLVNRPAPFLFSGSSLGLMPQTRLKFSSLRWALASAAIPGFFASVEYPEISSLKHRIPPRWVQREILTNM